MPNLASCIASINLIQARHCSVSDLLYCARVAEDPTCLLLSLRGYLGHRCLTIILYKITADIALCRLMGNHPSRHACLQWRVYGGSFGEVLIEPRRDMLLRNILEHLIGPPTRKYRDLCPCCFCHHWKDHRPGTAACLAYRGQLRELVGGTAHQRTENSLGARTMNTFLTLSG